jgi:hypothetical protein
MGRPMIEAVRVGLNQLVLWYDGTRIQTWPAFLSTVPDTLFLPSATDFGRRFDTERMTDQRHAAAEKIVRNLPGLEAKNGRIILKGVGLLTLTPHGYCVSPDGSKLRASYVEDPKGKGWVRLLAKLMLGREPRTRVVIRALSVEGAELRFDGKKWFGGSLRKAQLLADGIPTYPFHGDDADLPTLRTLLRDHSWWALGEWRDDPLLKGAENCRFTGTLQEHLSLHDVGLGLRGPFEILLHLGVLQTQDNLCWIDRGAAIRELGKDLSAEFGWEATSKALPIEQMVANQVRELRSDTGYVIASDLRQALRREGIENPDAEIARLQSEGKLVIEAEDFGQARHGEGLFGDPRKQMVQIRVLTGSAR